MAFSRTEALVSTWDFFRFTNGSGLPLPHAEADRQRGRTVDADGGQEHGSGLEPRAFEPRGECDEGFLELRAGECGAEAMVRALTEGDLGALAVRVRRECVRLAKGGVVPVGGPERRD